ncbi:MAG: hypothetical protein LBH16_00780 [Treponema sp.]|jgi:hypothetical protein|nr:hypothetical protein [Treponema sp.]
MKKKMICSLLVFLLAGITNLSAQMSKKQLQDMYITYLKGEGYNPALDRDGDVNFTAKGQKFYIEVIDNDLSSFHLVLTEFLDIGGASNRLKALDAASAVTRTTSVVRLYITSGGKIAIDTYIFLAKPEDFKTHFNRMVNIIVSAREEFLAMMK